MKLIKFFLNQNLIGNCITVHRNMFFNCDFMYSVHIMWTNFLFKKYLFFFQGLKILKFFYRHIFSFLLLSFQWQYDNSLFMFVYLFCFVLLGFFLVPLENFSLIWRRHRDAYTCCRTFGTASVTTCLTTSDCRGWDSNIQPSACEANVLNDCTSAVALYWWIFSQCNGK